MEKNPTKNISGITPKHQYSDLNLNDGCSFFWTPQTIFCVTQTSIFLHWEM